ncbi:MULTISPECIES: M14 family metallopeptidase [unclassified Bacillus (in: firmicutes)]|uniref:M14 family metallopeptidase n=1 Tax=unclassified Bacillus (in: firmicutes) TaxID=185979 RepID=UPI0008EE6C40|nr:MULTISPECIES: M14 family metallopeptidase [unclassified Bacillus (in: firmicutes)]SFB06690.1 Protein of unknown function [Bacillus sp. UNCCL13]SFQ87609.1 Protein of unknown function [Bacillus sp. cl95]
MKGIKALMAVAIVLMCTYWIVPLILLSISSPSQKEEENLHYPKTYEQSKKRFMTYEDDFQKRWETVHHMTYEIDKGDLTTDVLWLNANVSKKNLIVITSGVHGIEGYVGSAMMDYFKEEISDRINPDNTGVVLVHAVNPWGMEKLRRYNENNVDLNRNFITDWGAFSLEVNEDYKELNGFFEKEKPLGNITLHELGFLGRLGKEAFTSGTGKIENALLAGQFTHPEGVYYGGNKDEKSTIKLKSIYEDVLNSDYENIVHIDLHTGYGPKYQMSIFSSASEKMSETEAKKAFDYPLVFTPDSDEFYVTNGDNTEYLNQLAKSSEKKLYSTTFEFGTLGNSTLASILSLKNTIDENRLFWQGASSKTTEKIVKNRYREMFYPSEEKWREKAIQDFEQGLVGVLDNRGIVLQK